MAKKLNAVPRGYRSATPALVIRNAAAAVDYYAHIFGATELSRIYAPDAITIQRAEIKIGNSILHLSDEMPIFGVLSPLALGGASTAVQLYLDDIDAVWQRALDAGCTAIIAMETAYWGERSGRIIDPFGHVWTLSQRVEAVSKAELEKRIVALFPVAETPVIDEQIPTVDIRSIEETFGAEARI